MLLLVTDTSGKQGFVGLVRVGEGGQAHQVEMIEEVPLAGGTFSAQLVPQIAALLAHHGFSKGDIDGFVVVSGPGSFTGLRVGLAAIKGLAVILRKPIVPVSLLEVIALAGPQTGRVFTAMDAGRGEVYAGEYELAEGNTRLVRERLLSREGFLQAAGNLSVVTADASLAKVAQDAGISACLIGGISAEMIARLGWRKMRAGHSVEPDLLDANYIRHSDAEIFSKPGPP